MYVGQVKKATAWTVTGDAAFSVTVTNLNQAANNKVVSFEAGYQPLAGSKTGTVDGQAGTRITWHVSGAAALGAPTLKVTLEATGTEQSIPAGGAGPDYFFVADTV